MVDLPGTTPVRAIASSRRAAANHSTGKLPQPRSEIAGKKLPQLVSLANELANGPPPIDHARLARIRAAISNGSYRIDPDQIATALLGRAE